MPKKLYNEPSPLETRILSKRFRTGEFRKRWLLTLPTTV